MSNSTSFFYNASFWFFAHSTFTLPVAERHPDKSCFGLRRKEANELELEMVAVSCVEPR